MAKTATDTPTAETPPKKERRTIADRVYADGEGNEGRSATPTTETLTFRFKNDHVETVRVSDFPEAIQACLAWHGLSQKLGDSWAGAKGDVDLAITNFGSLVEQLTGGTWVEKGEGIGTAPSLIVEAIVRALQKKGEDVDDDRLAEIREKCKDKDVREGAKKDPAIFAEVKAIEAERALERAEKAAKAAGDSVVTTDAF